MVHNWGQVLVYKEQLTYWNVTDSLGLKNHHQHGFSATLALSIKCFKRLSLRIIASKHLLETLFFLTNLYLLVLCGTWGKRMLYYYTILRSVLMHLLQFLREPCHDIRNRSSGAQNDFQIKGYLTIIVL